MQHRTPAHTNARRDVHTATLPRSTATNANRPPPVRRSLRKVLFKVICCIEEHTKRTVCELLLELCDQKMNEFTLRAGYGNAVFMHHIKGAISIENIAINR